MVGCRGRGKAQSVPMDCAEQAQPVSVEGEGDEGRGGVG